MRTREKQAKRRIRRKTDKSSKMRTTETGDGRRRGWKHLCVLGAMIGICMLLSSVASSHLNLEFQLSQFSDAKDGSAVAVSQPAASSSLSAPSPPSIEEVKAELLDYCGKRPAITYAPRRDKADTDVEYKGFWVPGFPGSGSEMFISIINAMTGLDGSNVYLGCNPHCATCKSHFPRETDKFVPNAGIYRNKFQKNAWLLLRNPTKSIPSFENFNYESVHKLLHHKKQMPEAAWKQIRKREFSRDLDLWGRTIKWWMRGTNAANELSTIPHPEVDNPFNISLIIQYEKMISPIHGPLILQEIAAELQGANIPVPIDLPAIEADAGDHIHPWSCFWAQIVLSPKSNTKRSSEGRYTPSYTATHQAAFLATFDELIARYTELSPRYDIVPILKEYRADVINNIRLDEGA
eukprot:CAMPEP_0119550164 /NCGR_PEP_ID=MMETSP1352-20130426/3727_1 /TAXON_ID=265584 /ORGANISM="Stauroneis constricta, Strain CCMP1120" /LENGTH=406 /DNA_ID=CAMNT_0007595921 /DNA_START=47 /DNA_END=1267 /DNA_ORIENTATION=-